MSLLAVIKRLTAPAMPPRCAACKQDVIPLESYAPSRFFCRVCARDFEAVYVDGDWRMDLTPLRHKRRR
jgi:hypothetical protein